MRDPEEPGPALPGVNRLSRRAALQAGGVTLGGVGAAALVAYATAGRSGLSLAPVAVAAAADPSTAPAKGSGAAPRESVVPALVPKARLSPAPADEVNVAYAPNVPPASGRTEPAIVEVHFEVVENVTAIDPDTGVEYETWGYRISGSDEVVSGTPGPMIRARVGRCASGSPSPIPRRTPCRTTWTSTR